MLSQQKGIESKKVAKKVITSRTLVKDLKTLSKKTIRQITKAIEDIQ